MEQINLGKSDLRVPAIGFGAWQAGRSGWGEDYSDQDVIDAIRFSIDNGVNFIDTAEVYGWGHSEEIVGKSIDGYRREDVIIATKVAGFHFRYRDVINAAENSLKRLNTDYIDLYQLHWPDNYINLRETISALEELVNSEKVRAIGLCNFPVSLIKEVYEKKATDIPIASNQLRYNVLQREVEEEIFPFMKEMGITMMAWSPIAKGLLTGKYGPGNIPNDSTRKEDPLFRQENLAMIEPVLDQIRNLAEKYDKTMAQVSLNYLLCKGAMVIPGAKNVKQAKENMGGADWRLSPSEVSEIDIASDLELSYS